MAKVPLPDRGQPLDVTYLYRIASAVNDLSDTISTATYNYTTINTKGVGTNTVKNSDAKIYATYEDVVTGETVSSNTTKGWTINFDSPFQYPPLVTATVVNTTTGPAAPIGNDVIITVTNVTAESASGVIRFNSSGNITVSINLIAIGLPG
jgi:hypothetical protein